MIDVTEKTPHEKPSTDPIVSEATIGVYRKWKKGVPTQKSGEQSNKVRNEGGKPKRSNRTDYEGDVQKNNTKLEKNTKSSRIRLYRYMKGHSQRPVYTKKF
jgi:hypothetical protein